MMGVHLFLLFVTCSLNCSQPFSFLCKHRLCCLDCLHDAERLVLELLHIAK